jgi:predicted ATP-dependent protease
VPATSARTSHIPKGIKIIPVSTLKEAIKVGLVGKKQNV